MGIIRHSEGLVEQPETGISRVTIVHRGSGADALTTRIVTIAPGTRTRPHRHKVEEAMMVLFGVTPLGDPKPTLFEGWRDSREKSTVVGIC